MIRVKGTVNVTLLVRVVLSVGLTYSNSNSANPNPKLNYNSP